MRSENLYRTPNALARHYSSFRVAERLLLTGHSHQAWPDVGLEAQRRAWLDAAERVDDKWDEVARRSERVGEGFRRLMGGCAGDMALDANVHGLLVRFLSALPLRERPRIVTTGGEFHSVRRQLDRLAEEGVELVKVPTTPAATLAERLAAEVDGRTACAVVSAVLYASGLIVRRLELVAAACARHGAELLVDAYHALNVVPLGLDGLEGAFVAGGGYKYCQLGEGNCVLRVPPGCALRPVVTGWFAEFAELAEAREPGEVRYGEGAARFAGSTYEPTSRYRAAAVLDFFEEQGLTVDLLRDVSQHQVGLLVDTFRSLDPDPRVVRLKDEVALEDRGGFLALEAGDAAALWSGLRARDVHTDYRGSTLRFGPAPYLSDEQIVAAVEALGEVSRAARNSR